jgi:hypothetical protein
LGLWRAKPFTKASDERAWAIQMAYFLANGLLTMLPARRPCVYNPIAL